MVMSNMTTSSHDSCTGQHCQHARNSPDEYRKHACNSAGQYRQHKCNSQKQYCQHKCNSPRQYCQYECNSPRQYCQHECNSPGHYCQHECNSPRQYCPHECNSPGQYCQLACNKYEWGRFYEQFCTTSSSSSDESSNSKKCASSYESESFSDPEIEIATIDSSEDIRSESDNTLCSSASSVKSNSTTVTNMVSVKKKSIPFRSKDKARICLDLCSYELVEQVAKQCGMRTVQFNSEWDVCWSDPFINRETHQKQKRFQRTNHFPLISELCRKNDLADNLNLMKKDFPKEYNFFPTTWILPQDYSKVRTALNRKKGTLIIKPDNGSNGNGIYLVRNLRHLRTEPNKRYICQEYIENPFLIDGYKFDFRVYTLITSCDPLRIYTHSAGLVRFATVKYEKPMAENIKNRFMHLTNYSVNKRSTDFIYDEEMGSKRKISTVNQWLNGNGYNVKETWARIDDVIIKSILSAEPSLKSMYNSVFPCQYYRTACFQLLGFDILLDEHLNPYVLEVNHSPSFYTDTELDVEIKQRVLHDTFTLCRLNFSVRKRIRREERVEQQKRLLRQPGRKKSDLNLERIELRRQWEKKRQWALEKQWSWEKSNRGGFRLIYPCIYGDKYEMLCRDIEQKSCFYKDNISSILRSALGRANRHNVPTKAKDSEPKNSTLTDNPNIPVVTVGSSHKTIPLKVPMKPKIPLPIKPQTPLPMKPRTPLCKETVELTEFNKETQRLTLEWAEREKTITSANLEEFIYFLFKTQNNLTELDRMLYGYLG